MPFTIMRHEDKTLSLYVNGFDMGAFYVTNENQRDILRWEESGKLEYIDLAMYRDSTPNMDITEEQARELLAAFEGEKDVNE